MNRKYSDLYLGAIKVIQERGWSKDYSTSPDAPVSVRGALDVALESHRAEAGTALVAVEFLGEHLHRHRGVPSEKRVPVYSGQIGKYGPNHIKYYRTRHLDHEDILMEWESSCIDQSQVIELLQDAARRVSGEYCCSPNPDTVS